MTRTSTALLALLAPAVLGLAACSGADPDDPTRFRGSEVPAESVTAFIEGDLVANGIDAESVDCGAVEDAVGESTTCTITVAGTDYEMPVTVSESTETETLFDYDLGLIGE